MIVIGPRLEVPPRTRTPGAWKIDGRGRRLLQRGLVELDGRDRSASSRRAVARCGDPPTLTRARRAVHRDGPRPGQLDDSRTRFRPDPTALRGESGLRRRISVAVLIVRLGRLADRQMKRHLRGPRSRRRLRSVTYLPSIRPRVRSMTLVSLLVTQQSLYRASS